MTKSITFTLMHFAIALTVAYLLTGSLVIGGAIALVEPLVNSVGYFFHEKVWDSIKAKKAQAQQVRRQDVSDAVLA
ncbi:DUF2061 domain-containing protein [Aestuariicella sp. G3-2]|uniref:DUF2061 domain-containing protein n=1 Tax=Pseudomaricurvus albidus TaxID=2842452 RepID=UPI001C0DA925|nr:DUF2061 domain-containing protein [Aestuariicella albida]MBU3069124.1 DUF2061 domain-containing protein [Aestuariicella albida]